MAIIAGRSCAGLAESLRFAAGSLESKMANIVRRPFTRSAESLFFSAGWLDVSMPCRRRSIR
eukprot:10706204-Prorocentrum_lima.AAC.1